MSKSSLLLENSLKYLCNLTNNLPTTSKSNLESLYLSRCCEIAESQSLTVPEILKSRIRCPRCFAQYDNNTSSRKIETVKRNSKFIRKLLKKCENGEELTKYQKRFYKTLKNKDDGIYNKLIETCGVCNHKRGTYVKKPKETVLCAVITQKVNKKKRKKDKFVGLNKDVILSVNSNISTGKEKTEIKPELKQLTVDISKPLNYQLKDHSEKARQRKLTGLKNILKSSGREKAATDKINNKKTPLQQFLSSI